MPGMTRRLMMALVALVLALVSSPRAFAQPAVPAVGSELVRLDAVVTDAQGQPVRGLVATDFELLEDGRPQRLTHFLFVAGGASPAAAAEPSAPALPAPPGSDAPADAGRHVVIVVDDLHISASNLEQVRRSLVRFVGELLQPGDRVAVLTTGSPAGVRQLTTDRAPLQAAIQGLTSREAFVGPSRGTQMTAAQAEMVLRGDRSALRLASRALISEPGSVYDNSPRSAVEGPGQQAAAGAAAVAEDSKDRAAEQEARRQAEAILAEAARFSAATLTTIEDVIRSLAPLPGRKLCLVVSDGFLVGRGTRSDQTRRLQAVVDAATRSGTVVYALDSRGLAQAGGDASVAGAAVPPGLQQEIDRRAAQIFRETLAELSGDTGGFLVHGTNEPAPGLRRMLADNEAYYLLAYEPANTKRDGRFRRIQLRVPGRAGLAVRTRSGYFAPDERKRPEKAEARPAPAPTALSEEEARRILDAPIPAPPLPLKLVVDYLDLPPAGGQAIVRARVDVAGLTWRESEGRRRSELELVSGAYDAAGAAIGPTFTRRVDLDLAPAEYDRAQRAGLQYQHRMSLPPGRYDVRFVVTDGTLAPLGGTARRVEIPNLADDKLTLSSLFLSATAAPSAGVAGAAAGSDETLLDMQLLRRFKRGATAYFQMYVYNVVPDGSGATDVVLQAQILSSGRVLAASKPQAVVFEQKGGVPLPQSNGMSLEGLEPGPYELRVVVVDRKANATAFRSVDFTIE
jgi:VWFA-related protein